MPPTTLPAIIYSWCMPTGPHWPAATGVVGQRRCPVLVGRDDLLALAQRRLTR
jgi:hypothetical protein